MVMLQVVTLKKGGSCYGGGQLMKGECHVRGMASLMEGEWSCYRGWQFERENGHVTEVATLMEGACSLQKWSL